MPDIVTMISRWQILLHPLGNLPVSISDKCADFEFFLKKKLNTSDEALFLHMITSFHLVAL